MDVIIKKNCPFDDSRFARMRRIAPSETFSACFSSPEDVSIKKLEYYRLGGSEKHLRDITGMMKISGTVIDIGYIQSWAARLGLSEIWTAVQKRLAGH